MHIGITGSRTEPPSIQVDAADGLIRGLAAFTPPDEETWIHQGCCVGFDLRMTHRFAGDPRFRICGHLPTDTTRMDPSILPLCDELMPAEDYLSRDRKIVRHGTNYTVAGPKEYKQVKRGSGTWYTTLQSLLMRRETFLVFRGGEVAKAYLEGRSDIGWTYLTNALA
jgi:hypothetical protein